ncbi:ESX secretion-associated protein EspG [Amycolatopsis sp. NPDC051061]|uniref:ESX secretion-associated protein EspG n=1 Tax=Amycolatopsis sp. NPDC051061 TaxID=3155042 RepID=UPI00341725EC
MSRSVSVIDAEVIVPRLAFLTAWDMLDLGEVPAVFGTGKHFWMDDTARRQLAGSTFGWLSEHGLARGGRVNPLWRDTLRVIAEADIEFYGWSNFRDESHGGLLVAVRGDSAIRAWADRDTVVLQPIPVKWPATSLVEALPQVDGAPVRAVTVAQSFYDDPESARRGPLDGPVDRRDLDHLDTVLSRPRDAVHQLYTAIRVDDRDRVRSSPISAIDIADQGRVLTYVTGDARIVLTPGTPREIVRTLNDTAGTLRLGAT